MKKIRYFISCLCIAVTVIFLNRSMADAAQAQTIYNSPYVTFSPDGKAWTTNAGDTDYEWYEEGTTVSTGITSSLRELNTGEHYYKYSRTGTIPVGYWEVVYRTGTCVHNSYPQKNISWHDIDYERDPCGEYYYSGWNAYCADCGDKISEMLMYMSREAAESIDYIEVMGNAMEYYYLCPYSGNLEQGSGILEHKCDAISWNQYKIHYDPNTKGMIYGGYMEDSIHMYNNATEYEGNPITPATRLTKNAYTRIGYEFTGWNTEPDGSGISYQNEQEILNLTSENREEGVRGKGIVILYAQWRLSESTLQIDPDGGTYNGKNNITSVTEQYLRSYTVDNNAVGAPKGYTVSFEVNGGNAIAPITGTQHFTEWSMQQPFKGDFYKNVYTFIAPDGNTDTITANYEHDPVTLPSAVKAGSSFGGWYYDQEFDNPAGGPGDTIIPDKDLTLYAQWVDLKLYSEDNYIANDGKGAVDLSWTQSDSKNKTYMIYQSRDNRNWLQINSADDISNGLSVSESFNYTGSQGTYIVPYTGLYTITADGAQGSNYGDNRGGPGGQVSAKVWLVAGEELTYTVGGQNGFGSGRGGTGTAYGNGGGATKITSDIRGLIAVAGGGGAATLFSDGEAGGSSASLRSDGASDGADNEYAGGGGGYVGGNAGQAVIHNHTDDCYMDINVDILSQYASRGSTWDYYYEDGDDEYPVRVISYGLGTTWNDTYEFEVMDNNGFPDEISLFTNNQIPTGGATSLRLEVYQNCTVGQGFSGNYPWSGGVAVYDQNGKRIFYKKNDSSEKFIISTDEYDIEDENPDSYESSLTRWWGPVNNPKQYHISFNRSHAVTDIDSNFAYGFDPGTDVTVPVAAQAFGGTTLARMVGKYWGSEAYYIIEDIELPVGTTSVTVVSELPAADMREHTFYRLQLSGERKLICGYTEGQIVSNLPAYGGSNYINTDYTGNYTSTLGVRSGDGQITIQSEKLGFLDVLKLDGVKAADHAAPDKVSESSIVKEPVTNSQVRVSWDAPEDNGTVYYHVAESYLTGSATPLCRSNITRNVLTSGVTGYYCLSDENPETVVTEQNGTFSEEAYQVAKLDKTVKYLHVAAIDKAGNIGATTHISIDVSDVSWKLYTRQLIIENGDNVYPANQDKSYYVKSDGVTPFTLDYQAYMDGPSSARYQPNYAVFDSTEEQNAFRNILYCKGSEIQNQSFRVGTEDISFSTSLTSGKPLMAFYPLTAVMRSNSNKDISVSQAFTLDPDADGKIITLVPTAGADHMEEVVYSDYERDKQNGLVIIGDGQAPVIYGLDGLESLELIDRNEGTVSLQVTAVDALSGIKDFYIEVYNQDNVVKETYTPGEDGSIRIDITKDEPIFSGDFIVTAYAADNVGNENSVSYMTTEFALQAEIERILEPHEPVFKCGESGILRITTWGYADHVEVEFPEELLALNPELNKTYVYTDTPQYKHEETSQFMVPLYTPINQSYEITVRAYKGDKKLEEHPSISVIEVNGSVLDEIRTRLR